jgi:myo-inositol 2-dehydrogenase / D-chiro-inositol 1-dehydrogenase
MNANRREFLTTGAIATAATLASGGVFAAGNDVIKVGLIGCGGRGTGAAMDCLKADENVKLIAMGDVFKNRLDGCLNRLTKNNDKRIKEKVDVKPDQCFVGLDAYKKVVDSGVDLVLLATPPGFRPQHLDYAIKAKKHVFTEKPVAVDAPGIRKVLALVDEAKKNNTAVVAGTQRRHQKGYIDTIKQLHDGAIGNIVSARCYWNGDGIWFNDRKDGMSDVAYQIANWYHFLWVCGDHIVEQHVHNLDVINWVLKSHPIKAYGMGGRLGGGKHRPDGDPAVVGHIFDHFAVEYEYPNGVRAFSFCRHQPGTWGSVSEAVQGTKGWSQVNAYTIDGKPVGEDTNISAYEQEHIDLIQSIRAGKPLNELQAVTESTMTAIMGRMATYTGKALTWDQALNSKEDTFPKDLTWDMQLPAPALPVPGKTKFV